MKKYLTLIVSVILVAALDQFTKQLAASSLNFGVPDPVIDGYFNLTLVHNKGAAFGMLADFKEGLRQTLLAVASVLAVGSVIYFLLKEYREDKIAHFAVGAILGGAVGNIIDRATLGYVIDFLDFYYGQYHWPAFNIADSAICVGVFVLVFRPGKKANKIAVEAEGPMAN